MLIVPILHPQEGLYVLQKYHVFLWVLAATYGDSEIDSCNNWLTINMGMTGDDLWGFRTPFLAFNSNTFSTVKWNGSNAASGIYLLKLQGTRESTSAGITVKTN